jgi:hypothetical protein
MENLPEKILFKIFRYLPRLKELTSVCRDWKTAVESYKVFEKLSFKEISPDDINYLVQSKRLYRQLDITVSQKSLGKLMAFLEHSQKTVEFLRIKVTRDGIFPLFSRKEFPDREGRDTLIKFQNLERFQLECFQHDDVMFIYRSCDLSGIRQLATNDFPGRDLVVQHVLDIVPNISKLQVINRERTPRLPPRLQGMIDDLEYATQKFCADTLNLVIFGLILVAVVATIFIQFYF